MRQNLHHCSQEELGVNEMRTITVYCIGNKQHTSLQASQLATLFIVAVTCVGMPASASPNTASRLRVRLHSSADLAEQSFKPVLVPSGRSNAAEQQFTHRPLSGNTYLFPNASTQIAGEGEANGRILPSSTSVHANGYTEPQDRGEAMERLQQWHRRESSGSRPYSARSPRFEGSSGLRTMSHDSLADPGTRALLAELQKVRASIGSGESGRSSRSGFMTPPPPPPPRTPPHAGMDPALATIERQGSFQASLLSTAHTAYADSAVKLLSLKAFSLLVFTRDPAANKPPSWRSDNS